MINLLVLAICLYFVVSDLHSWLAIFLMFTIVRFRFNHSVSILILGLVGTFATYFGPSYLFVKQVTLPDIIINYPFGIAIFFQCFVGLISIFHSFIDKIWKEDAAFIFMEPVFLFSIFGYQFLGGYYFPMFNRLENWIYLYMFVQILLILIKLFALARISDLANTIPEKIKLILNSIPHINPSFGYRDLELAGVLRFTQQTNADIFDKELDFFEKKLLSDVQNKRREVENCEKAQLRYNQEHELVAVFKKHQS